MKYYEHRMLQKPKRRKEHCHFVHGDYEEKTHMCTQYYWAEEMCVSISKNNITEKWELKGTKFHPESWGCAYKPKDHPSQMYEWTNDRNMKVVWQKMYLDSRHPTMQFFPLKYPPIEFHIRHAGDPLLAALNINHNLDFGMSNEEKKSTATATMVVSIIILICGSLRIKQVCIGENGIFLNTSEPFSDLKREGKRLATGGRWKNPDLWDDEP